MEWDPGESTAKRQYGEGMEPTATPMNPEPMAWPTMQLAQATHFGRQMARKEGGLQLRTP